MMRKLCALVGMVALVACLSACGVSVGPRHTISGPSVARGISSQLADTYKSYKIKAPPVSCPPGIPASKGTTFVCTTVLDGQHLDLDGTVTGANGQYQVVPRDAIIKVPLLVQYLTTSIKAKTSFVPSVNCGPRPLAVVAVGATITCSATFPRLPQPRKVITTVLDKSGQVEYTLEQ
jgi:hypothetical protein